MISVVKELLMVLCPAMTALPMLYAFASRNPRGIHVIAGEVMVRLQYYFDN
jgi:hypothetical protein